MAINPSDPSSNQPSRISSGLQGAGLSTVAMVPELAMAGCGAAVAFKAKDEYVKKQDIKDEKGLVKETTQVKTGKTKFQSALSAMKKNPLLVAGVIGFGAISLFLETQSQKKFDDAFRSSPDKNKN
jgi:hypothetical protein